MTHETRKRGGRRPRREAPLPRRRPPCPRSGWREGQARAGAGQSENASNTEGRALRSPTLSRGGRAAGNLRPRPASREATGSRRSLGLLTLAGMTPDPFEVSYHEVLDIHRLGELPDCDVAAIASYSAPIKDAYALADRFRAVGVRVVLGGLHVTAVPDEAMEHADAVVVGEGELGWPDLLADLRAGRPMRRVYAPHGREFDLADAPMPRFDLLDIERYNRLTVQTQRGCPWRCEFCAASVRLTPKYKVKPVAKVLAEIHAIKRIWPRPFIEFADDNTFVNRRHVKEELPFLGGG